VDISNLPVQARIVPQENGKLGRWLRWLDNTVRRLLDVVGALLGLILLAPFFILIALRIKRDSPGPIFYWGPRVGKYGRPFNILKFRTMYERPESYNGPKITAQADNRITPIGHWLRDTKLNELPQLWNVLKGDMSFVGPRPEDPDLVKSWPREARRELLAVRPGITSPASVLYRSEEQLLSADRLLDDYLRVVLPSKLRLDLLYVRHRTLLSDLDVLFWTALALLPQLKRKRIPEHSLFWGPLARLITRHFSWFAVDFSVSLVSIIAAGLLWRSARPLDLGLELATLAALLTAIVFSSVNALFGLHRVYWSKAPAGAIFELAISTALATIVMEGLNQLWPPLSPLLDGLLIVAGLLAFTGFVFARYRARILTGIATRWITLRGQTLMGERVLIVGAGEVGCFAAWLIRNSDLTQAFSIIGMVDDAPQKQGVRVNGLHVLGNAADIPEIVHQHDVGLVLYAIANIDPEEQQQILDLCHQTSAHLVLVTDILQTIRTYFQPTKAAPPVSTTKPNGQWLGQLTRLDELVRCQDWEQARAEIQQMRQAITSDSPIPTQ
jgi:lipopolysaccharide/colanic/teichoic acid biosynthesis glycosyltransferase